MASFSSNELNYLIWKYLCESGLTHTAFLLRQESNLSEADIDSSGVAVGALATIVQKGLYYVEAEICSAGDGNGVMMDSLSLIEAANEKLPLHKSSSHPRQQQAGTSNSSNSVNQPNAEMSSPGSSNAQRERDREARQNQNGNSRNRQISPRNNGIIMGVHNKKQHAAQQAASLIIGNSHNGDSDDLTCFNFPGDKIRFLKCHSSEVFICAWNPHSDLMASGSGDATTRIWDLSGSENREIPDEKFTSTTKILRHFDYTEEGPPFAKKENRNQDVTSLDWNQSGTKLATGCYDGFARLWNRDGSMHKILGIHKGPIFALKWSANGDYLVSAGVDKTTVVWDTATGSPVHQYCFHTASALDVEWITSDTFASCSTDKSIQLCSLADSENPLRTFLGHENEVNAVKFDQFSQRLASCSDDKSLRIWSLNQDEPVHIWQEHDKEIYTIRWSPVGNVLASASFDHTVRVWDVNRGECIRHLTRHQDPVYSVSFSPDGRYLASGCFNRTVIIWDVHTGRTVQAYVGDKNDGGIFEVSWNSRGDKIAASASDGTVILMDARHLKNRIG